jgi:hypothetical protein
VHVLEPLGTNVVVLWAIVIGALNQVARALSQLRCQSRRDVAVVVSSWIGRHWNWGRMALAALVLVGICLLVNIEVIEFICVYIWAKLCLCARVFIRKT